MPDIEPCSKCGKQVLISRYSWSNNQVICKDCEDLNIQSSSSESCNHPLSSNSSNEFLPAGELGRGKSKSQKALSSQTVPDEILVTWSSLLKISFGGLLILILLIFAIMSTNNNTKKLPNERLQSLKTDVLLN